MDTKLRSRTGEALIEYHIDQDAQVITESFARTKITAVNPATGGTVFYYVPVGSC